MAQRPYLTSKQAYVGALSAKPRAYGPYVSKKELGKVNTRPEKSLESVLGSGQFTGKGALFALAAAITLGAAGVAAPTSAAEDTNKDVKVTQKSGDYEVKKIDNGWQPRIWKNHVAYAKDSKLYHFDIEKNTTQKFDVSTDSYKDRLAIYNNKIAVQDGYPGKGKFTLVDLKDNTNKTFVDCKEDASQFSPTLTDTKFVRLNNGIASCITDLETGKVISVNDLLTGASHADAYKNIGFTANFGDGRLVDLNNGQTIRNISLPEFGNTRDSRFVDSGKIASMHKVCELYNGNVNTCNIPFKITINNLVGETEQTIDLKKVVSPPLNFTEFAADDDERNLAWTDDNVVNVLNLTSKEIVSVPLPETIEDLDISGNQAVVGAGGAVYLVTPNFAADPNNTTFRTESAYMPATAYTALAFSALTPYIYRITTEYLRNRRTLEDNLNEKSVWTQSAKAAEETKRSKAVKTAANRQSLRNGHK